MRTLWAGLLYLALACAAVAATPAEEAADARRQVLVLLNLPPEHFRPDADYAGGYGRGVGRSALREVAARLAREHDLTLVTDWPMPVLGVDCYVMQIPASPQADRTPENVAEALSRDRRVRWAQPMNIYRAQGDGAPPMPAHNDALYAAQPAAQAWRLAALHEIATGRKVSVAVVDSGVELQHPDLARQVAVAENFVDGQAFVAERHGTAVAGIIGALADNGIGIAGIAPQSRLMALRACWQETSGNTLCSSLTLAKALHFAITHQAAVINVSLSGPKDRLLAQLVDAALARGTTVVAAVDASLADGGFPASHAGVWAVSDAAPVLGSRVLLAPGRDVPTTAPGATWQVVSGSSYASAHVAGLAALLRELGGTASAALRDSSLVLLPAGTIDTCATLMRVIGPRPCSCAFARATATQPVSVPELDHPTSASPASDPSPRHLRRSLAVAGRRRRAGGRQHPGGNRLPVSRRVPERRGSELAPHRVV
jgi:subtilisin family serine protease